MTRLTPSSRWGGQLLICDPTCVQPFGHPVAALNHFRQQLAGHFDHAICVASSALAQDVAAGNDLERGFTFLYAEYFPGLAHAGWERVVEAHPAWEPGRADPLRAIAREDARALLDRHALGPSDAVFFPGGDFYGVTGFLDAIALRPPGSRPALFIRLVGVLEAATFYYDDAFGELAARLRAALRDGLRLRLAAETPVYADRLALATGIPTCVAPYPHAAPARPLPTGDTFRVLCAGSARFDKGYHHLFGIASRLLSAPATRPVEFVTQTLPVHLPGHDGWDHYTAQLDALGNVRLLEPVISTDLMHALYQQCDVVLLPYDPEVYAQRGSAVVWEAAAAGRFCLTLRGSGFARQVEYYGLGEVVDRVEDLPDAIRRLADAGREALAARMRQARFRFFLDVQAAYDHWFGTTDTS